jgi:hypothetical protein
MTPLESFLGVAWVTISRNMKFRENLAYEYNTKILRESSDDRIDNKFISLQFLSFDTTNQVLDKVFLHIPDRYCD